MRAALWALVCIVLAIATALPNKADPSEIVPETSKLIEVDVASATEASQVESVLRKLQGHPAHSMNAMEIEKVLTAGTWATVSQCRCGTNCYKLPGGGRPLCKAIELMGKFPCKYTFYLDRPQPKCTGSWAGLREKHEMARKANEKVTKGKERAMKKKHEFEVKAERKEKGLTSQKLTKNRKCPSLKPFVPKVQGTCKGAAQPVGDGGCNKQCWPLGRKYFEGILGGCTNGCPQLAAQLQYHCPSLVLMTPKVQGTCKGAAQPVGDGGCNKQCWALGRKYFEGNLGGCTNGCPQKSGK